VEQEAQILVVSIALPCLNPVGHRHAGGVFLWSSERVMKDGTGNMSSLTGIFLDKIAGNPEMGSGPQSEVSLS
jgi:hypothetical protein